MDKRPGLVRRRTGGGQDLPDQSQSRFYRARHASRSRAAGHSRFQWPSHPRHEQRRWRCRQQFPPDFLTGHGRHLLHLRRCLERCFCRQLYAVHRRAVAGASVKPSCGSTSVAKRHVWNHRTAMAHRFSSSRYYLPATGNRPFPPLNVAHRLGNFVVGKPVDERFLGSDANATGIAPRSMRGVSGVQHSVPAMTRFRA